MVLQDGLKIIESPKKEVDELQRVRVGLLEENEQRKGEKTGLKASLVQSLADLYKLGYADHLFGMSSDFEFVGKDFKNFSISPEDLLAFTFEAFIGEVVGPLLRMLQLLKVWRPSSHKIPKLLKSSLLGSL